MQSAALAQVRDTTAKRDTTRDVRVPVPARDDSLLKRDSLVRRDSIRAVKPPRDTLKAPIAHVDLPVLTDPGGDITLTRKEMFSTGAITVQDLLDRVPGVTGIRSGWISQPMMSAFLGDPGRVRVFLDGLELEELDPRMQHVWDLTQIPLWALDDIRIERAASEIRIHLRSWRVERTTPYTRTDVYTGDQSTNLYRGLFGRRYEHGEILQAAGQQYGTDPGPLTESSDQLGVLARIGIARPSWSVDAFLLRNDRNRGSTLSQSRSDSIPHSEATRSDVYLRAAWGKADSGLWVQGLASTSKYAFGGVQSSLTSTENADTSRSRSQYVLMGGYSLGPWRASVTQRYRVGLGHRIATPAARLGFDSRPLSVSVAGEGRGIDSTRRFDASVVARPLSFVFLSGAVGTEQLKRDGDSSVTASFARAEAGLRIVDLWLSAGVLRRDAVALDAASIFLPTSMAVADSSRTGTFARVRGRVWKSVYADAQAMQWSDTAGFYRPRYQTRSELYFSSSLPRRFPTGNFHLLASAIHEYRSGMTWPDSTGTISVGGYRTISTLVQVRILNAEVFWNLRNLLGERYTHAPDYRLPRITNIYGVRWEFWN